MFQNNSNGRLVNTYIRRSNRILVNKNKSVCNFCELIFSHLENRKKKNSSIWNQRVRCGCKIIWLKTFFSSLYFFFSSQKWLWFLLWSNLIEKSKMVYESDFYTTRRPYSSRPNVSSYSVTVRAKKIKRFSVVKFWAHILFSRSTLSKWNFAKKRKFLKCCGCWCLTKTIYFRMSKNVVKRIENCENNLFSS